MDLDSAGSFEQAQAIYAHILTAEDDYWGAEGLPHDAESNFCQDARCMVLRSLLPGSLSPLTPLLVVSLAQTLKWDIIEQEVKLALPDTDAQDYSSISNMEVWETRANDSKIRRFLGPLIQVYCSPRIRRMLHTQLSSTESTVVMDYTSRASPWGSRSTGEFSGCIPEPGGKQAAAGSRSPV